MAADLAELQRQFTKLMDIMKKERKLHINAEAKLAAITNSSCRYCESCTCCIQRTQDQHPRPVQCDQRGEGGAIRVPGYKLTISQLNQPQSIKSFMTVSVYQYLMRELFYSILYIVYETQ
ncbi:hypothetical protein H4Q26_004027 [Puccinia striiformis f. sp. tritici PST-130]|nr:hypothetical protein H4Q26_004027 [Puccinia striiformis f. sp. tritici PST-130]